MDDLTLNIVGGTIVSVGGFLLGVIYERRHVIKTRVRRRGIATILGSHSNVTVCLGGRGTEAVDAVTLREGDVLASLTLTQIADKYRGHGKTRIVNSRVLDATHTGDLVIVGGPHANGHTRLYLRPHQGFDPFIKVVADYKLVAHDGDEWTLETLPDGSVSTDYAVIYSYPEPEDTSRRVTLVFGLKGFGTRAAARFVDSRPFHVATRRHSRDSVYCLVLAVDVDGGKSGPVRIIREFGK